MSASFFLAELRSGAAGRLKHWCTVDLEHVNFSEPLLLLLQTVPIGSRRGIFSSSFPVIRIAASARRPMIPSSLIIDALQGFVFCSFILQAFIPPSLLCGSLFFLIGRSFRAA